MKKWILTNLIANLVLLVSFVIIFIIWGPFWLSGVEASIEEGEGYFLLFSFSMLGMMVLLFIVLFLLILFGFSEYNKIKKGEKIGMTGKFFQIIASLIILYLIIVLLTDVLI